MKTIHIHSTKRLYSLAAASSSSKPKSQPIPVRASPRSASTAPSHHLSRRDSLSICSPSAGSAASRDAAGSAVSSVGSPPARSLYTSASGPLHYFESGGGAPPPPLSSRPSGSGSSQSVSPSRASTGEAPTSSPSSAPTQAQAQSHTPPPSSHSSQQSHTQQSHHHPELQPTHQGTTHSQGQGHQGGQQQAEGGAGTSQPLLGSSSLSLLVNSHVPPPGSSPSDRGLLLQGPHAAMAAGAAWKARNMPGADAFESQARAEDQKGKHRETLGTRMRPIYQLDVGAYGIPKRGRVYEQQGRRRTCLCARCFEEEDIFAMDELEHAVQVGEDAYFVRDDALGVADGVGGWGSRSSKAASAATSGSHSCPSCSSASTSRHAFQSNTIHTNRSTHRTYASRISPSALFARRLMHFCAKEVGEARAALSDTTAGQLLPTDKASKKDSLSKNVSSSKPSLKCGGINVRSTNDSLPSDHQREVSKKRLRGNARPFAWPWEEEVLIENSSSYRGQDYEPVEKTAFLERDGQEKMRISLGGDPTKPAEGTATATSMLNNEKDTESELKHTVDPAAVLERAYAHTLDAHRVRVVKTVPKRKRPLGNSYQWWSSRSYYGIGFGAPPAVLRANEDASAEKKKVEVEEIVEWEPLMAGSSTALLAVLSGDRLRVAHLGDCVGWLVRAGEIVWRTEEMWWGFNCPLQLGPVSPTQPCEARRYELNVQEDDILILASDGMSDNLWEEDVLDEVRRFVAIHRPAAITTSAIVPGDATGGTDAAAAGMQDGMKSLGRRTLAGMLSEALCSRARRVSEQTREGRQGSTVLSDTAATVAATTTTGAGAGANTNPTVETGPGEAEEVPFARRAREEGKLFRGGKCDDISVLVAVISPIDNPAVPHHLAASAAPEQGPVTPKCRPQTAAVEVEAVRTPISSSYIDVALAPTRVQTQEKIAILSAA